MHQVTQQHLIDAIQQIRMSPDHLNDIAMRLSSVYDSFRFDLLAAWKELIRKQFIHKEWDGVLDPNFKFANRDTILQGRCAQVIVQLNGDPIVNGKCRGIEVTTAHIELMYECFAQSIVAMDNMQFIPAVIGRGGETMMIVGTRELKSCLLFLHPIYANWPRFCDIVCLFNFLAKNDRLSSVFVAVLSKVAEEKKTQNNWTGTGMIDLITRCIDLLASYSEKPLGNPDLLWDLREDADRFVATFGGMNYAQFVALLRGARPQEKPQERPQEENNKCIICMDADPECVFLPCKHMHCCETCANSLVNKICPSCRQGIENVIKVFK